MYLPNCKTNLVIALHILSPLFCKFINTIAYHLGRYEPSSAVSCRTPPFGHSRFTFTLKLYFQIFTENKCSMKIADGWIRTQVLCLWEVTAATTESLL